MARYKTTTHSDREADCIAFYLYGRTERDIENFSQRHGLTETSLRGRLSTLFQGNQNGEGLWPTDRVSLLWGNARPGIEVRPPALEMVEHAPAGLHSEPAQPKRKHPRYQKTERARQLIAQMLENGPRSVREVYNTLVAETGMSRKWVSNRIEYMVNRQHFLVRANGVISLPPNGQPQRKDPTRAARQKTLSSKKLPKGETGKIITAWLKRLGPTKQADLTQRMVRKNEGVAPQAFAAAMNSMVAKGVLLRSADGVVQLA